MNEMSEWILFLGTGRHVGADLSLDIIQVTFPAGERGSVQVLDKAKFTESSCVDPYWQEGWGKWGSN